MASSVQSTSPEELSLFERLPNVPWNIIMSYTSPLIMRLVSRTTKARIDQIYFRLDCSDGYVISRVLKPWETLLKKIGCKLELCTTIKEESVVSEEVKEVEVIYVLTIFNVLNQIRCMYEKTAKIPAVFMAMGAAGGSRFSTKEFDKFLVGMIVRITYFFFGTLLKQSTSWLFLENGALFSQCMDSITVFLQRIPLPLLKMEECPYAKIICNCADEECAQKKLFEQLLLERFANCDVVRSTESVLWETFPCIYSMLEALLDYLEKNKDVDGTQLFSCWSKIVIHLPTFRLQMQFAKQYFYQAQTVFSQSDHLSDVVTAFLEELNTLPLKHRANRLSMLTFIYDCIERFFAEDSGQNSAILEVFNRLFLENETSLAELGSDSNVGQKITYLQQDQREESIALIMSLVQEVTENSTASKQVDTAALASRDLWVEADLKQSRKECSVGLKTYFTQPVILGQQWRIMYNDILPYKPGAEEVRST